MQWFAVIVGFCREWVICKMLSYFYDTKSQEDGLWFQLFYIRVLKRSNSQSHGYSGAYTGFCPRGLKSFSFQKWWGPETLSKPYEFYWSRSGLNPPPASAHAGLATWDLTGDDGLEFSLISGSFQLWTCFSLSESLNILFN